MGLKLLTLAFACILSPVIAMTIGTIAYVGEFGPAGELTLGLTGAGMIGAWLGAVVGVPTMLLIGLPLHVYFRRRGITGLAPYAIGGALAGILAFLAVMLAPFPSGAWPSMAEVVARLSNLVSNFDLYAKAVFFGALTGVLAASMFWFLRQTRRPAPNPPTSTP